MRYASVEDVKKRVLRTLSEKEEVICNTLLEDASVLIDAYNANASESAKRTVSCNMVIRALGSGKMDIPIGATQGTMSGLGYSQTWTMGGGASTGELYVSKADKKMLGCSGKLAFVSPYKEV